MGEGGRERRGGMGEAAERVGRESKEEGDGIWSRTEEQEGKTRADN